jgi:hypothetical protein
MSRATVVAALRFPGSAPADARSLLAVAVAGLALVGPGAPVASAADNCPNAVIRAQRSLERLPNCRAYELVSPLDKTGADVGVGQFGAGVAGYSGASGDGNRMMFSSPSVSVGDAIRGIQFYATATRTAEGWRTVSTIPGPPPSVVGDFVLHIPKQEYLSDDASAMQFAAAFPYVDSPLLPAAPAASGLYLAHTSTGVIDWLNRPVAADAAPMPGSYPDATAFVPAGGSPDFRTSYFSFCGTLVAEDAPRAGQPTNFGFYVARDGVVSQAGILPDGSLDPLGAIQAGDTREGCTVGSTTTPEDPTIRGNQVSRDGSRAFFVSPNPYAANSQGPNGRPPQLYVHREGKSSLLVSRSLADPATPTPAGVSVITPTSYVRATPDGRYVVFASTDRLTADAPSGSTVPLRYRFDVETEQLTYLPGLDGPIKAVSEDGQRVLFGKPVNSQEDHLALYDHGTVRVIDDSSGVDVDLDIASSHVSADGNTWVFSSTKQLRGATTDPAPRPSPYDLASEVYRYVVGDDGVTCISCPAPGAPSSLGASIDAFGPHDTGEIVGNGAPGRPSRNVSPDGKRVFFYTPNALLPEDVNTKGDVYMWENGALTLISTGKSPRNTYLLDSSASGDDVFFASVEELFPGDVDEAYDVYDARVGGGQAGIAKEESCSGDGCQGSLTSPPGSTTPPSATFQGLGNPPVVEVPSGGGVGKPQVAKVKTVRGTSTRLSVKVPGKGAIRISGPGLTSSSKTVSKAGTYAVTVRLSERAQRTLARKHRVKVRIGVRFVPSTGKAASVSVAATFTSKSAARSRRATVLLSDARKSR